MKIGFIGLGHMGTPMALNLLKNKFEVIAYDINEEALKHIETCGANIAKTIAECVASADAVITMLQTGQQVKQCCVADNGIFANLKPGALFIDSSTIDIETSRELHEIATQQAIAMLDAPVSGGVSAAQAGTLTFMVGGNQRDFAQAQAIFAALGKKIILAGNAGAGCAAKICNNMLLGISMIGVCEAFVLAKKLGLEPQKLFDICNNASGQCWSLSAYCPYPGILPNVPSSHNYQAGFTSQMMLKDLALSQQAAKYAAAFTPLGAKATALYEQFANDGSAQMDFSGIIKMLEEQ